jgi:hypothetical protein
VLKEFVTAILPDVTLPRVYTLLPVITPIELIFPYDIMSFSAITLPPVTLPDTVTVVGLKELLINRFPAVIFPKSSALEELIDLIAVAASVIKLAGVGVVLAPAVPQSQSRA